MIDYPNSSKAKKHYLCIDAGNFEGSRIPRELPDPLTDCDKSEIKVNGEYVEQRMWSVPRSYVCF